MSSKLLSVVMMLLIGVGVMTLIIPVHANTLVPIASTFSGFCAGACSNPITFTVQNSGDILVLAISYRTNNVATEQTPTVTDGSNTWTQRVHAAQALPASNEAEGQVWTTTAAASGSLTVTVAFASVGSGQWDWLTAFDLVGYTLTGITSSIGGGTSGTTASVSNIVISNPSAVIGAISGATMFLPLQSSESIGFTSCADAVDFGAGRSCGSNFFNGGFTSAGSTLPISLPDGNTWVVWAEGVLVIPQVAAGTTTVTSTVTTTVNTTSYPTSIVPEQILAGLIVLIIVYGLVAKSVKGGIGGLSKEYA